MTRFAAIALAGFAAAVFAPAPALSQNFPDHPIKIVVPYPAGGPADTVARVTTGTPPDVIAKVNAAENALLKSAETQAAIAKLGLNPLVLSPQGLGKALTDELHLWRAVVSEAGVRLD
jgi:tripartite-type tricarboxylate transporter receptor subunit TctC